MSSKLYLLPPDDLPPTEVTREDGMLQMELEQSTGRCFFLACDRITRVLLSNCQWYLTTNANILTLIIDCPDIVSYWHIVSNIPQLGNRLERFSTNAKIRVYPPFGKGMPFEIGVHEISAYRDWL
ncbi:MULTISPECIES: hypothetical protein [Nostoc]|uniref:Uncharacterized protein n=1 Tax=Nostoc paludosum FACHB-159 TaxID=2692908 RepID=A0ABR8KE88_9NOSO|nr:MULTISPECIES: hypothetical protein [Nostoc]MBD2681411.1 hypothetical protein [Nostoc sp. FACHB-857]MBD2737869.1 hypothetical protein [Nostoc paludosum FACHB-159]MDZ8105649.1 hypothetical protein [Nostoc sp. DedQUE12a]